MRAATRFALLAVAASLAACGGGTAEPAATPSPSSQATGPSPASTAEHAPSPSTTPAEEGTANQAPETHLEAIRADLDSRGIDGGRATVTEAKSVTWPNGSLGCGEPGASYTQAQVPGWRVVVEVDGTSYDYRFGRDATPMLCERPAVPEISSGDI